MRRASGSVSKLVSLPDTTTTAPACVKSAAAGDIHPYASSVGDYISLALTPSGPAMVVYDRIHGIEAYKADIEALRERVTANAAAIDGSRRDNAAAVESVKKDAAAALESVKKDASVALDGIKKRYFHRLLGDRGIKVKAPKVSSVVETRPSSWSISTRSVLPWAMPPFTPPPASQRLCTAPQ